MFDEQAQRRYLMLISRGRSPALAAEDIGFAHSTIKRYLKQNVDFANGFNDALDTVNGRVEEVLLEKAHDGDFQAIKMWLTNRSGGRWQDQKTLNTHISGPGGSPIQIAQSSVLVLREVLTDGQTRKKALGMLNEIPALGPVVDAEVIEDD